MRILPNTEELAAGYRKELYEYGGQLNEASLKAAIADLQARRAALLPAAVPEGGGYPLLNDGYADPDHPELDMTGTVRKDYFIRFTGLQRMAADSLAQLRHIDEKLAEMNRWLQEPQEFQKKVHRWLKLLFMGYLTQSGANGVKVELTFSFRGVRTRKTLCDVNSGYARWPEYQSFVSLHDPALMQGREIEELDRQTDKALLLPTEDWRAPTEALLGKLDDAFMESVNPTNQNSRMANDKNGVQVYAFYRKLKELAEGDLTIMPGAAASPTPAAARPSGEAGGSAVPPPPPVQPAVQYHAILGGVQTGPLEMTQLKQKAAEGSLTKDTLVWTNGMPAWAAAGTVDALKDLFPAAYYAILGGVQTGPLEMTQLKQKAAEGSLKKDTLVWTDGMPAWAAAGTVDVLKDLFPAVSPPPVPSAPPVPPVPSAPPMPPM